jgi:hypothetical protein
MSPLAYHPTPHQRGSGVTRSSSQCGAYALGASVTLETYMTFSDAGRHGRRIVVPLSTRYTRWYEAHPHSALPFSSLPLYRRHAIEKGRIVIMAQGPGTIG